MNRVFFSPAALRMMGGMSDFFSTRRDVLRRQRASGLSVPTCCHRAGVGVSTFYRWRQRLEPAAANSTEVKMGPAAQVEIDSASASRVPEPGERSSTGDRLFDREGFELDRSTMCLWMADMDHLACPAPVGGTRSIRSGI